MQINGISIHVEDHGTGAPVLLLHGWPDSSHLWRHQIPFLVSSGFRAIAPDMRGFGRSEKPVEVAAYRVTNAVADVIGILDTLGIGASDVVAHDWGAGVAWMTAALHPDRVKRLVILSVPHPSVPLSIRQREMFWYQLFFQFEGIAEAWLRHDNWALFRDFVRGGEIDRYIDELSRPGALTASLNWYRANRAPRPPAPLPELPPIKAPTLAVWSTNDSYLEGKRVEASAAFVEGPWRYEQIEGVSHWIPLNAPDRLNQLLLEWLK